ncbi:hypothetical protein CLV51_105351 [Chitinophaga niastensis]|uniref:Beta-lactamase superfamily II metal-dependent hydrolase n=1 Tax=Chitinophaga niastensis TaxID=536980 RepID=A0A2P8HFH6_CHINA|nr:hypothetical protein [Chitinophaga niastensis]PSL44976.1 hypothetical protein CLV51_105351 [Chitinophaga niastensis]
MSHTIKFYPIGNADCTFLKLSSGKQLIFDYADKTTPDDYRCNLPESLNKDINGESIDVVAFTHADLDHVQGFENYFYLEHASKYQEGSRKKIEDLWVPAHVILEEGCDDSTRILRAEARYRLRNKKGIKVFSKPNKLKDWLKREGIELSDVRHLIVDAGELVPGWNNTNQEVEFFAHAPFAYCADGEDINRNDACLILHARFKNLPSTEMLLLGDADWQLLHAVVRTSEKFGNSDRLAWDICHISHHCSYLSLAPEKGDTITTPVGPVKELFENHGKEKGILISPSNSIPTDYDAIQPPHRQAYNYYKKVSELKNGEIRVTMEWPSRSQPMPIEITINNYGATILKTIIPGGFVTERQIPKAG